jgi:hypothetical protein
MFSMMMDILPETPGPLVLDVRQNGAGPLVGGYEWNAFDLVDTRADWLVKAAKPAIWAGCGDALIDLQPLITG